jgi:hypothetical protein
MKPTVYILMLSVIGASFGCSRTVSSIQNLNRSAIFGGSDISTDHKLAHTVIAIHSIYPGANEGTICSGTLISESHVITAAHCLIEKGVARTVLFGVDAKNPDHRRKIVSEDAHPDWAKIEKIHAMPEEERSVADHVLYLNSSWSDMAVLKFEGGLPDGYFASEILTDTRHLEQGVKVIAAGYGVSETSNGTGTGRLRSAELLVHDPNYHDDEFSIEQTEAGTCEGDSGGPIFYRENNGANKNDKLLLAGLTSHGINDVECRGTTVFTSVGKYAEWLKTHLHE